MKDLTQFDLNNPALILNDPREGLALQESIERLKRYFPAVIIHTINKQNKVGLCFTAGPVQMLDFLNTAGHRNMILHLAGGAGQVAPPDGPNGNAAEAATDGKTVEFPKT